MRHFAVISLILACVFQGCASYEPKVAPFKVVGGNIQLQGVLLKIDDQGRCREIQGLQMGIKA